MKEYEVFLCVLFGLCYYSCSLSDVLKHPVSCPLFTQSIKKLKTCYHFLEQKIARMNDLLCSFEGQSIGVHLKNYANDDDDGETHVCNRQGV